MKQFLFTIAGVFVGLILFFIVLPIILISSAAGSSKPVTPGNSVLVLDLRKQITDQKSSSPFSSMDGSVAVVDVVNKLYLAQTDNNVKGLYVRAPEGGLAPAHAEEIRQAILDFQNSGKFVVAHAQGFEMPTLSNYAAISGAKDIWIQAGSDFTATGMVSETMFYGGLFEKFGIIPQFEQFYEYKNAANVYTQKDYTEAHKEATTSLLSSVYNSFLADIAFDRKIDIEKLKTALDAAPLTPDQAMQAKLVSHIGMPEEALDFAISQAGGVGKAQALDFAEYSPSPKSGPTVAIINGEGAIMTGPDQKSLFNNEQIMNSDAITAAIREATDDNDIKAIVFRVSSPGGSAIGSEQIWAAVERAKAKKKPVVISMGAYAASGGYYVAAGANKIVAMPTTITGSIGVLGGKMAVNGALNKYTGINVSSIQIGGPYASALSGAEPFTNSQREAFHNAMARIYAQFTGKVATGRKIPLEKVQEIAKGRVWTGQQAQGLGLVDKVGGLMVAIEEAKALAGIEKGKTVTLKQYPVPEDPFTALASMFGSNTQAARAAAVYGLFLGDARLNEVISEIQSANDNHIQAKEYMRIK